MIWRSSSKTAQRNAERTARRRVRGGAGYRAGLRAEWLAALWLRLKGYRVLATRFRSPAGEVDLIAVRGRTLVAIEVKRRKSRAEAAFALTTPQMARIRRGLVHFVSLYPRYQQHDLRVDAILIAPRTLPVHSVNLQE